MTAGASATGAVSIGVVIHGDSHLTGHGPGIQVIMTCGDGTLVPQLEPEANLARYLKIGRFRPRRGRSGSRRKE